MMFVIILSYPKSLCSGHCATLDSRMVHCSGFAAKMMYVMCTYAHCESKWLGQQDTCRGHIPLYGADIETNTEKTNKYEYCFRLYSRKLDRSYYLIADSQEELDSWIEAIKMETTTGALDTLASLCECMKIQTNYSLDSLARGGGRSAGNLLIESSDDGDTAF